MEDFYFSHRILHFFVGTESHSIQLMLTDIQRMTEKFTPAPQMLLNSEPNRSYF